MAQLRAVRPRARSGVGRPGEFQSARFAPAEVPQFIWWGMAQRSILGSDVLLSTELYQPLSTRQYLFVAPHLRYSIDEFDLYASDLRFAEYRDQTFVAGIDLGANFINTVKHGSARGSATATSSCARGGVVVVPVGDQQFVTLPPEGSVNIGALTFAGALDRLDSINFPRYGYTAIFIHRPSCWGPTSPIRAGPRWQAFRLPGGRTR